MSLTSIETFIPPESHSLFQVDTQHLSIDEANLVVLTTFWPCTEPLKTTKDFYEHLRLTLRHLFPLKTWAKRTFKSASRGLNLLEVQFCLQMALFISNIHMFNGLNHPSLQINLSPLQRALKEVEEFELMKRLNFVTWRVANFSMSAFFHNLIEKDSEAIVVHQILLNEYQFLLAKI